jgi:hypothetical protein
MGRGEGCWKGMMTLRDGEGRMYISDMTDERDCMLKWVYCIF